MIEWIAWRLKALSASGNCWRMPVVPYRLVGSQVVRHQRRGCQKTGPATQTGELQKLGMFELRLQGSVEVLDLTASNLVKYRLDAGILSDYDKSAWPPYKFCPAWSALAIDLGLGGIVYRSRHPIDQSCLALFESGARLSESGSGTASSNSVAASLLTFTCKGISLRFEPWRGTKHLLSQATLLLLIQPAGFFDKSHGPKRL